MTVWAGILALLGGLWMAAVALADAPDRSLIPLLRPSAAATATITQTPDGVAIVSIDASPIAPRISPRPPLRDDPAGVATVQVSTGSVAPASGLIALLAGQTQRNHGGETLITRSLVPQMRPDDLQVLVMGTQPRVTTEAVEGVALCGQSTIVGDRLPSISGRINGCGISNPVRVRAVDGVLLDTPATINCDAALALQDWLSDSVLPAVGRRGGGVTSLRVVASYSCRTRNNQPGARLSEHSTGNAIDIAAIGLADGSEISVLRDWGRGQFGRVLAETHRGACGPFGTVLGPNSDRYHRDHFHFDVAAYRSGPYCR